MTTSTRTGVLWLCLLGLSGCGPARRPYVDDPLLLRKPPRFSAAERAAPTPLALAEPTVPAATPAAWAALEQTHRPPPAFETWVQATTVLRVKPTRVPFPPGPVPAP